MRRFYMFLSVFCLLISLDVFGSYKEGERPAYDPLKPENHPEKVIIFNSAKSERQFTDEEIIDHIGRFGRCNYLNFHSPTGPDSLRCNELIATEIVYDNATIIKKTNNLTQCLKLPIVMKATLRHCNSMRRRNLHGASLTSFTLEETETVDQVRTVKFVVMKLNSMIEQHGEKLRPIILKKLEKAEEGIRDLERLQLLRAISVGVRYPDEDVNVLFGDEVY